MTGRKIIPKGRLLGAMLVALLAFGCSENPGQHLDLGMWYYQKGLIEDAILEYKEAVRLLPSDPREMSRAELKLVSRAHYNLAIAYAKKDWYELAMVEAKKNFDLRPTQENYRLVELIEKRQALESYEPGVSN